MRRLAYVIAGDTEPAPSAHKIEAHPRTCQTLAFVVDLADQAGFITLDPGACMSATPRPTRSYPPS
jgi:hypothetical protein